MYFDETQNDRLEIKVVVLQDFVNKTPLRNQTHYLYQFVLQKRAFHVAISYSTSNFLDKLSSGNEERIHY